MDPMMQVATGVEPRLDDKQRSRSSGHLDDPNQCWKSAWAMCL